MRPLGDGHHNRSALSNARYVRFGIPVVTSAPTAATAAVLADGGSTVNFGSLFAREVLGTGTPALLGVAVVANVLLTEVDSAWPMRSMPASLLMRFPKGQR